MTNSVPEQLAKYVAQLVQGTHEITSVTIQPKRTWAGLTEEDIEDCLEMSIQGTCRAIEAKLKEKNNAD